MKRQPLLKIRLVKNRVKGVNRLKLQPNAMVWAPPVKQANHVQIKISVPVKPVPL